ncbi:MAG: patatin-like phospholipase family protein [bacterium]
MFKYFLALISIILLVTCSYTKADVILDISKEEIEPNVALVLSGGGARGLFQIGVLKVFEQNNIPISEIAGTSMGAMIGGLYSSGFSADEIKKAVLNTNWPELSAFYQKDNWNSLNIDQKYIENKGILSFRFHNFNFHPPQTISENKTFEKYLHTQFSLAPFKTFDSFDSLYIPFRVAVTDLINGKPLYLARGNLVNSIRASCTVPIQFRPVRIDSSIYIDGGIFANLPSDAVLEFKPDLIIGVNSTSPPYKINEFTSGFEIADQTLSILMKYFEKNAAQEIDFIITPTVGAYKNTDFKKIDSLIIFGENESKSYVNDILWKYDLIRKRKLSNALAKFDSLKSGYTLYIYNKQKSETELIKTHSNIISIADSLLRIPEIKTLEFNSIGGKITITPSYYPIIEKIIFATEQKIPDSVLSQLNRHFYRKPYDKKTQKKIMQLASTLLKESGYTFTFIQRISMKDNIVSLKPNLGRIDSIEIKSGNISKYLVKRELLLKKYDLLNSEKIIDSWDNLMNCGLFENIEIIYKNNTNGGMNIALKLEELGNQEINAGFRIDLDRNFRFIGQFVQYNLWNTGTNLSTGIIIGERDKHAELMLFNSNIGYTPLGLSVKGYYTNRLRFSYNSDSLNADFYNSQRKANIFEERAGLIAELETNAYKIGKVTVGMRNEFQRTFFTDSVAIPDFKALTVFRIGAKYDTENKPYFANQGIKLDFLYESSLFHKISELPYSKASFAFRYNFKIKKSALIPQILLGMGDRTLPEPEFFSLGGNESFYGMREDELRGQQFFKLSLELRRKLDFKIFFDTYVSARYDWGNVFNEMDNLKFTDVKHGIGLNFALDTPAGPAVVALGKSFSYNYQTNKWYSGNIIFYFTFGLNL